MTRKKTARENGRANFLGGLFTVSLDGLSERGTTRSTFVRTDNVRGQISEHVFQPNGSCRLYNQWGCYDRDFPLFNVKTNKFCLLHLTGAVLEEYSRTRNKDAEAICDLSMYNYLEVFLKSYSFWSAVIFCHETGVIHHVVVGEVGEGGGGTWLICECSTIIFCHEIEVRHHVVVVLIHNITVWVEGGGGALLICEWWCGAVLQRCDV